MEGKKNPVGGKATEKRGIRFLATRDGGTSFSGRRNFSKLRGRYKEKRNHAEGATKQRGGGKNSYLDLKG